MLKVYKNTTNNHTIFIACQNAKEASLTLSLGYACNTVKYPYDDSNWECIENMKYESDVNTIIMEL